MFLEYSFSVSFSFDVEIGRFSDISYFRNPLVNDWSGKVEEKALTARLKVMFRIVCIQISTVVLLWEGAVWLYLEFLSYTTLYEGR